jgi:DNA-binding transcriptional regulator YiaG
VSHDPNVLAARIDKRAPANRRGCLVWQGAVNSRGYGCIGVGGKSQLVHRVAYELFYGPIPEGLTLDHSCFNTRCGNPLHLEAVTQAVNNERAVRRRSRTDGVNRLCPQGHLIEGENLVIDSHGHRACLTCKREATRQYMAERRNHAPAWTHLGAEIKAVRAHLGWRQQDVADFLGIRSSGQVIVSEWERGRAQIPAHHLTALRGLIERAA